MRRILVAGLVLAAGTAAVAEGPSFDCGKAESSAEKLVCGDGELGQLDREAARLYALALDGPHMTPDRRDTLVAMQRGWVKGRDDCWKADDLRTCVLDQYVIRIAELRQGYADARSDDAAGISLGPFVAECPGLDAVLGVVFVNSDPGAVYLAWRDRVAVLPQGPSGSGARYAATLADGDYLFWNKGDEAQFEAPGVDGTLECTLSEPG
jgi:uncharacterized protein